MIATGRTVVAALSLAALVGALAGCQKEGPLERAGKDIDNAVKKVTQRIELPAAERDDAVAHSERQRW
ncbi:MAG: hypothetical protein ABI724_10635 [Betaproteobacteria bacterium]